MVLEHLNHLVDILDGRIAAALRLPSQQTNAGYRRGRSAWGVPGTAGVQKKTRMVYVGVVFTPLWCVGAPGRGLCVMKVESR